MNYVKIAVRNLLRNRFFTLINVAGLALSLSLGLLLILVIAHYKRFDQFHAQKDRIYRITTYPGNGLEIGYASAPKAVARMLEQEYGVVTGSVVLAGGIGGDITAGNKTLSMAGYYASEGFFDLFSFPLQEGNPSLALKTPYSIVLGHQQTQKLFGTESPLGQTVSLKNMGKIPLIDEIVSEPLSTDEYVVTGVMAPAPGDSHLVFDFLVSGTTYPLMNKLPGIAQLEEDTDWRNFFTGYVYVLTDGTREGEKRLAHTLKLISAQKNQELENLDILYVPQALTAITPGELLNNPTSFALPNLAIYFLGFLVLIVLLTAGFNYTNLTMARSITRAREVGVRKVMGARKTEVFLQFIAESAILSLLAFVVALALLQFVKSGFANLWFNQYLQIRLDENLGVFLIFLLLALATGVLAGAFPAYYLSQFRPAQVLKSLHHLKVFRHLNLRKILIVVQFAFSLVLISTTMVVYHQFTHLLRADYGFEQDNLVVFKKRSADYDALSAALSIHKDIVRVSGSSYLPASGFTMAGNFLRETDGDTLYAQYIFANGEFVENLGLQLLAGTNLPAYQGQPSGLLLNEMAAKKLGYENPADVLGEFLALPDRSADSLNNQVLPVVGVVKDFQHNLLLTEISPFIFMEGPAQYNYISVKVTGQNLPETTRFIESTWKNFDKVHDFEHKFFDDQLKSNYAFVWDLVSIIGFVSLLAVVISVLGLLGIASYTAQTKVKEIGIRKIMGASAWGLMLFLSKGFLWMLFIATLIALPVSYYLNQLWLQEFAVRVNFVSWMVLAGVLAILGIGVLTIASQTYRAATSNPVEALRAE